MEVPIHDSAIASFFLLHVSVWIEALCIFDDAAQRLGGGSPGIPCSGFQIGDDFGEEMEKLVGMRFLNVSQLLRSGIADQWRATIFKEPRLSC